MPAYTWGNAVQLAVVTVWFCALIVLSVSAPALDYASFKAKTDYIVNNPAEVIACEAAAVGGDSSCVGDFYVSRAWRTWKWYVLYFTPTLALVVTFFTVVYLMFQKYGLLWFVAAFFWAALFLWLVVIIVFTSIYWVNCKDHSACSNARFNYADLLGFGSEVKHSTSHWWIVHLVAHYVLFLCIFGLVIASVSTQCCLSFSVDGRDYGLDPLFTRADKKTLLDANRVEAGIDSTHVGSPLDGIVDAAYLHDKGA